MSLAGGWACCAISKVGGFQLSIFKSVEGREASDLGPPK